MTVGIHGHACWHYDLPAPCCFQRLGASRTGHIACRVDPLGKTVEDWRYKNSRLWLPIVAGGETVV